MPLTYATLAQFRQMREITVTDSTGDDKIIRYLMRATRHIDRVTRRKFFPYYERRNYAVPVYPYKLRARAFPGDDLVLDNDLLEVSAAYIGDLGDEANWETITENTHFVTYPFNIYPRWALRLIWPQYWTGSYSNTAALNRFNVPSIFVDAIWGYHEDYNLSAWLDTGQSLTGSLTADATTFEVGAEGIDAIGNTDITAGVMLKIGSEFMEVRSITGTDPRTVTVIRGVNGTTAAAHSSGDDIHKWRVHEDIEEVCLMIADAWRHHDSTEGGRAGVSDYSVGVEVDIPPDAKYILLQHRRPIIADAQ